MRIPTLVAVLTTALLLTSGCGKIKKSEDADAAPSNPVPKPDATPKPRPESVDPKPKGGTPSADYAELGEESLTVANAPSDAPLRPPAGSAIYQLTNVRVGNPGPGPSPKVMVEYERIAGEEKGRGPSLVLRTADGNEFTAEPSPFPSKGNSLKAGEYRVDLGFSGRPGGGAPQVLEVYLVHVDKRWEGEGVKIRFKVSNSAVLGEMRRSLQFARDWKPDEAERIKNPPPEAPAANQNKNIGEDTEFAVAQPNKVPVRYVDPQRRPLIGLDVLVGDVDDGAKGKEKGVRQLGPVYDVKQPSISIFTRVTARPGYAIGAAKVKTKKAINSIELVFMKLKPDGTLDKDDIYTKMIGFPEAGEKETKLGGDGRKVIGFHMQAFGSPYAFALVMDQ